MTKPKHVGAQSIQFAKPVPIIATASVVGPKEGEGPLGQHFDVVLDDMILDEKSWEKAESSLVKQGMELAVKKAGLTMDDMDYLLAGDLLNQSIGSTFGIRDLQRPLLGIFGACSTMGEGMGLGSCLIDGGFASHILVGVSSHFCAAEKQFRFPLELGTQRTPTSTWTVTGEGAVVLAKEGNGPAITGMTTGKIVDMGVTDANNMGAAMAPAAADTLVAHFKDFGTKPSDYDVIATGDLGQVGSQLLIQVMKEDHGYEMGEGYTDCGLEIFDSQQQDTHAGGSGCACSAVTFAAYFYEKLKKGAIKNMLFVPTGALMNATTSQQGESIPGIAHAVVIENIN